MRIGPLQPSVAHTAALEIPTHTSASTPMQVPHMQGDTPPLRERPRRRAGSTPPLVPLNDSAMTGKPALVALDSEFSEQRLAEVQARQITVQTLQDKLATHLAQAGAALTPDSIAARFAAGALEPVYLDTAAFNAMSRGLPARARAAAGPVLIDAQQDRIIFNLQRAFASGDTFSDAALTALGKALDLPGHGLATPDWLQPAARTPARRKLQKAARYHGHEVPARDGGAAFFKANDHRLLQGKEALLRKRMNSLVHDNYFEAPSTRAIGTDVMVHRGLFDNHAGIPENSLSSIDHAYLQGYRNLELDVEVSADGVPVLLHDFSLGRTTGDPENRLVSQIPFAELREMPLVIRNPADATYVKTNQTIAGVEQMLEHVLKKPEPMSVALDCKEDTGEAVAMLLMRRPDLRKAAAIKVYAKYYTGGFDQFLSNLYKRYQINPLHSQDAPRRAALDRLLAKINVVPVFSQGMLANEQLRDLFPGKAAGPDGLADTAMQWLESWTKMRPVIVEAVATDDSDAGKAMKLARARMRQPDSAYAKAAYSVSYRYEDFSVPRANHDKDYYIYGNFGELKKLSGESFGVKRTTAGAIRDEGESLLTDQPEAELLAILENRMLARGHIGNELDVPPETPIDIDRDAAIVKQRIGEFQAARIPADPDHIAAVREGQQRDHTADMVNDPAATRAVDKRAKALGLLTDTYRGAPVTHYLNEQANQTEPD
ncbi:type III secretion system effector avirulence protein AvrBs2 [Xanthomonas vasicola]|uniref:Avirulence protein n=1 Tax=Xanthomonas vasicola TaxID=56459 RepID=A0ABD7S856_XANVA|nr:type III secretion system effector avirulence protein AvrBs2 [Xanthomonas vasicola]AZR21071.1 avirulence protein [Xanthomonas vasicola]KGR39229.1 avirulence protein [Xanthomonas vasicola]KGR47806.1 avirulence protein [Xanthomonas vasicola]KGR62484.1 avirulence protein [Xanthomonas vasicola]MDO6985547.1 type III secretion system effector avirulence protein AvrBs2 [Xanthomonas vasicola]